MKMPGPGGPSGVLPAVVRPAAGSFEVSSDSTPCLRTWRKMVKARKSLEL